MGEERGTAAASSAIPPERWTNQEALEAVEALKAALTTAGIVLPSVAVDFRDHITDYFGPRTGPLVELGRARPDVILALAEVIKRGASHSG